MVKLILLLFVTLVASCSVSNNIQKEFDFRIINIENNGSYSGYISSNETVEFCKSFVLKKSEIIAFFKKSGIVAYREYSHDLTASNCYASGSFVTSEGIKGIWKIDRARRGFINFNASNKTQYYYCAACINALFYES
ncbi:MAG: hypothetical protein BMS9Abin31_0879 [Gammaproteobacteria bacterium]|nr:MAG: hypothetical protein BMS9Abin31_0879 [Gammaproteobacteria bacterium]